MYVHLLVCSCHHHPSAPQKNSRVYIFHFDLILLVLLQLSLTLAKIVFAAHQTHFL